MFKVLSYVLTAAIIVIGLSTINDNPFKSSVFLLLAIFFELVKINIRLEKFNGKIPTIRLWKKQSEADSSERENP